jgi:hypothetical protein
MTVIRTIEQAIASILATYSSEDQTTIRAYYNEALPFVVWDIQDKIDQLGMRTDNYDLLQACRSLPLPAGINSTEPDIEELCLLHAVLERLKVGS